MVDSAKVLRSAGLSEKVTLADNSVEQGFTHESAIFDVPNTVSEERVQFKASNFRNQFGNRLEKMGFTVLLMEGPKRTACPPFKILDTTRKWYRIMARVRRRPVEHRFDAPDSAVPQLEAMGMKLAE